MVLRGTSRKADGLIVKEIVCAQPGENEDDDDNGRKHADGDKP